MNGGLCLDPQTRPETRKKYVLENDRPFLGCSKYGKDMVYSKILDTDSELNLLMNHGIS